MAETQPKILLVAAATSTTGGGERHVADLMRGLPQAGFTVELLAPPGGEIDALARTLGITTHAAHIAGVSAAGVVETRDAINRSQPDLVHAHGTRAAWYARIADTRAPERVIYTVHGIHVDRAGSPLRQRVYVAMERALRTRTRQFVCVCEADARRGSALGIIAPDRTSVIYNGVPVPVQADRGAFRKELGVGPETPLALCVGRYSPQKGHATLLHAWALVRVRMPDAVLALIGSGPLEAEVRVLADSLGLGGVRFCATRPDLSFAYADADVLALPSLWEGLPYVVLEALASGTPVVSTEVDGIPEAVTHGVNGLLVPPSAPEPLAAALVEVLEDRERAHSMGAAGRAAIVRRFGLDDMIGRLTGVYRAVLGQPRPGKE